MAEVNDEFAGMWVWCGTCDVAAVQFPCGCRSCTGSACEQCIEASLRASAVKDKPPKEGLPYRQSGAALLRARDE